jgi:glycerol kinase
MPHATTHLLALDQGTSSSRAIVFDAGGGIVALAQREFRQIYPQPGWVEHDPREIWVTQLAVAREAMAKAGLAAGDIAALGITNQRETTLVWNRRTGEPIANAIVWQDRRTAPDCAALRDRGLEPLFRERTGLVLDAYFSGTKLRWMLDHVAGARAAAERGELPSAPSTAGCCGSSPAARCTPPTSATPRGRCSSISAAAPGTRSCSACSTIPMSLLPEVKPSSHLLGRTQADVSAPRSRSAASPATSRARCSARPAFARQVKNTYGTGCFMLMNTGADARGSANGLITTRVAQLAGRAQFAREGSVFIGGAVVQWLRDGLRASRQRRGPGARGERARTAAASCSCPPSPASARLLEADARGTIVGLTRGSGVAHIARAALESIAFQSAALLARDQRRCVAPAAPPCRAARRRRRLRQRPADAVPGRPARHSVIRPKVIETTPSAPPTWRA